MFGTWVHSVGKESPSCIVSIPRHSTNYERKTMNHTKKMNRKDRRRQVLFKHLSRHPEMTHEDKLYMYHFDFYPRPSSMKLSYLKVPGNYNHIGLFDEEHFGSTNVFKKHVFRRTKNNSIDVLPYRHIYTDPVTMMVTTEYYKKK